MGPEIAFLAVLAALWAAGWFFLRATPSWDAAPSAGGFPAVSVIIPARNEEDNLPRLLDSLAAGGKGPAVLGAPFRGVAASSRTGDVLSARQHTELRNIPRFAPANPPPEGGTKTTHENQGHGDRRGGPLSEGDERSGTRETVCGPMLFAGQGGPGLEVIVVDDGSTDGTADVARARGARVVPGRPLPPGWLGKPWACYQGALAARGEWLLFLDADTFFEEGGLRRLLEIYQRTGGVLSVCPHHAVEKPHEQLSAFFNLMMAAGTGAFTGPRARPNGLFGQCMLLDRAAYFGAGGHVTVRGRVLENFHLADAFRARGVPLACRLGRGCLSMRMYPGGLSDLVRGWGKGFASGAAKTPAPLMALIVAWMIGAVSAFLAPAALPWGGPVLLVPYGLYVLQLLVLLRRVGTFSPWAALLYPVPLVFYLAVFTRSVRAAKGGGVVWKGRTVGGAAGEDGHAR